ncbi:MAG: hypothetical protein WAX89_02930 [Alphaproteobacteria bacterium]
MAKLHYNKAALLAEYNATYAQLRKILLIGIGGAIFFFFVFIVYLGSRGHTKHAEYYHRFADRFTIEYSGQKLPMYNAAPEGTPAHGQ